MFDKLKSVLAVFRYGNEVANVEAWKKGQITGTVVGALFLAMANAAQIFGYPFPIDADSANAIGVGLVSLVSVLLTAATSKRAGLMPGRRSNDKGDSGGDTGMQNPNIGQSTRDAALQSVSKTSNPLA